MTTALQRLLKYPHAAVFDKAPGADLALRVRHDDGAVWVVADEVMTVTAGALERSYDLAEFTIGSLAQALQDDGFQVPTIAQEWQHRSALALVEGRGDQGESNGDHVQAFTSLLWVLLSGYAVEVREAEYQVEQALLQMSIKTAEAEWLDLWGALYGVARAAGATDPDYRAQIPEEAFRLRVNGLAIEKAIKDVTGKDVKIEEPWEQMFRLDESRLSGRHVFHDGRRVGYHLIRPVSFTSIDWSDVMPVIHRNRAAGIEVLPPEVRIGGVIDAALDGTIHKDYLSSFGTTATAWVNGRLDFMVLSEDEVIINWRAMVSQVSAHSNADALADPISISTRRTVAKASIVLSDGPALGSENAIFPRSMVTHEGLQMTLSEEAALSSGDLNAVVRPVDEVFLSSLGTSASYATDGQEQASASIMRLNEFEADASVDGEAVGGLSAISKFVGTIVDQIPWAVKEQTSSIGMTSWNSGLGWGQFTWGSGGISVDVVTVESDNSIVGASFDTDILEIGP